MSPGFLGLNNDTEKAPVVPVTSGTAKVPFRAQGSCMGCRNLGQKGENYSRFTEPSSGTAPPELVQNSEMRA